MISIIHVHQSQALGGIAVNFSQRVPPITAVAAVDTSAAQHRFLPANTHHVHVHGFEDGRVQAMRVEELDEKDWRKVFILELFYPTRYLDHGHYYIMHSAGDCFCNSESRNIHIYIYVFPGVTYPS